MSLPLVHLSGSPLEQGREHGRHLRDRVAHNLTVYFDRFRRETRLEREEVLQRAGRLLSVIERESPDYAAGMRGVAEGAGFSLLEIAALNVRYEILYYQFGAIALAEAHPVDRLEAPVVDGCTAYAVAPEASENGHLLVGQNWDWIPQVQGAVLHTRHGDGLETLAFTEAGIFGGKIGLNSAGVGLCINGLTTTDDDWSRPVRPVHVRCYEILRSRDFDEAVAVVTGEARACSTNFLVAQAPNRAVDLEAAPNGVRALECENACLVHANHFLEPDALGVTEPPNERRPHSYQRQARMRELLESKRPLSVTDIQEFLRDKQGYPDSICRHANPADPPEEHYVTVTGVVMDLQTREMWITDGPPDLAPFERHALS